MSLRSSTLASSAHFCKFVPAGSLLRLTLLASEDMTHGWRHSALISQWLDVPEISIRNFYIPHLLNNPEQMPLLFKNYADTLDTRHMNTNGHRATAE